MAVTEPTLPTSEIRVVNLRDLKPAPYNPRSIDPAAMAGLTKSVERFGYVEPIIWNQRSGYVVGGHQRLKVLRAKKVKQAHVVVVDLDAKDEKALNVALNNPHIAGTFTRDLANLLEDLRVEDDQLFHELRFDTLLAEQSPAPAPEPDRVPPLPKVAKSKRGDLYVLGDHRLYCGDATSPRDVDKLMAGEVAEAMWTDPPYNVQYVGKTPDALKIKNDAMEQAEFGKFLASAFTCAYSVLKPGAAAYVAHAETEGLNFRTAFIGAGFYMSSCLIWRKNVMVMGRSDYHYRHEPVLYGWRGDGPHSWFGDRRQTTTQELGESVLTRVGDTLQLAIGEEMLVIRGQGLTVERIDGSVFFEDKPTRSADHPTTKPVGLIERMLRNSTHPGFRVLDLFGGSGSTLSRPNDCT